MVAYQFNPICCNFSFTNDASLLLPKGTLTENYIVMSYPNWTHPESSNFEQPGHLTVVATEDDTEVVVKLSDRRIREGEGIPIPDEDGTITVPFSNTPGRRTVVLTGGGISSLANIRQQAERYNLSAGFYVDREALTKGKKAEVAATCAKCQLAKAECKCPKAEKCAACGMAKAECKCPAEK